MALLIYSVLLATVCFQVVDGLCIPTGITSGNWLEWSSCTRQCAGGTRRRVRHYCYGWSNRTQSQTQSCNQFCYNGGSFVSNVCTCPTRRVGRCCESYRPCNDLNGGCKEGCRTVNGQSQCTCRDGYQLRSDESTCTDTNECQQRVCDQLCTNTIGSFRCACRSGYLLASDGRQCTDIDECTDGTAKCDHICTNKPGYFACRCSAGYQLDTDGYSCKDVDECAEQNGQCSQTCINDPGSFHCGCNTGYRLNSDKKTCTDIDECQEGISGCSQLCRNTPGGYTCDCRAGHTIGRDGRSCEDIDDCIGVTCQHGGTCVDNIDSFSCVCYPGYTGHNCENDIDECAGRFNGGCEDICINSEGSFRCQCSGNKTIAADGFTCDGGVAAPSVFRRENIVRKLLPRGCSTLLLTRCTEGRDIQLFLSSTSAWYQLRTNTAVHYTFGIVVVELDSLALPVSITGMTVSKSDTDFKLITGDLKYTASDGVEYNLAPRQNCWSFELTPRDVHDFLSSNSFLRSFYNGLNPSLPNWLKFSIAGAPIFDTTGLKSKFMHGRDIQSDIWCKGAPVFENHLYTVMTFTGDLSIALYGQNITAPKPLHGKQFCFIIDICQDYGGSVFLILPEGSRDILQMMDIFKSLHESKGIRIRPRGIGVSLQKNINVHSKKSSLQLWNGDNMFQPIFSRSNLWVGGKAYLDSKLWKLEANADIYLSVPYPNEILQSVFLRPWEVYFLLESSASLEIKFDAFGKEYLIKFNQLGAAAFEAYASLGGVTTERRVCGQTANPAGMFLSLLVDVNPFRGIPILDKFGLNANAKLHVFFATDPASSVSDLNRIDVLNDIIQLRQILMHFTKVTLTAIERYSILLDSESAILLGDLKSTVTSFINVVITTITDFKNLDFEQVVQSFTRIWTDGWSKIERDAGKFVESIEFNNRVVKHNITDLVISETNRIKTCVHAAIAKLLHQVFDIIKDYQGFGLRFTGSLKIFGLKFGLRFEVVHSVNCLGQCSKFKRVYEIFKGESSVRILAVALRNKRLGYFLKMDVGAGFGMACSVETIGRCMIQIHAEANLLGMTADADVFINEKGLQFYVEGNIWNVFKAQLEVFAEHGRSWAELRFTVRGRFLANTGKDNNFVDSYLNELRKMISDIGEEAHKRLDQAKAGVTKAQSGLTTAQRLLTEKQHKVRSANKAFDEAIYKLESAKQRVEDAKEPFQRAIAKLNNAQKNVDNLCRIRSCLKICIPGSKCKICTKKVWGVKVPYPCCRYTSCMFKIPNPSCEAANLACRVIRGTAYKALEAAKIFVRIPMLALDAAKAALTVAQFVVDKSRVVLDLAVAAMELAKVGLEGVKGEIEAAKIALEGVKLVVKIGLKVFDLIIKYGLQSSIYVKNCGFEIEMSTGDLPVFEVSCDVNAFMLGWQKVKFTINFNDPIQTLWQAAKSTVKMLVETLDHIFSGKRKRSVEFEGLYTTYRVIRAIQGQEMDGNGFESYVNETIDVTYQTLGFKNTSFNTDEAEIRINIFREKCSIFKTVFSFFTEANEILLDIASETVTMMNNISSVQDEIQTINITDLQTNKGLEDFGIDPEVAMRDYNLTKDNLNSALGDAKESFANDTLLTGISTLADDAKSHINSQAGEVENVHIANHWMLAMENTTVEYFEREQCASFMDCAHFAISQLYDLFYAQNLPNTTVSLEAISLIEDLFLDLTGNRSNGIRTIHNLTSLIDVQLKRLDNLALFCSDPPTFMSPLTNQTVKNGTIITLSCAATGNPEPIFWWFRDGEILPEQHARVLSFNSSETTNLTQYQCMAGNVVTNRTSDVIHIIIEAQLDDREAENTAKWIKYADNSEKDTVVIVTSVIGAMVAVAMVVGVVVWRAVLRHRFSNTKASGSFASLNMVRPDSSMPTIRPKSGAVSLKDCD